MSIDIAPIGVIGSLAAIGININPLNLIESVSQIVKTRVTRC